MKLAILGLSAVLVASPASASFEMTLPPPGPSQVAGIACETSAAAKDLIYFRDTNNMPYLEEAAAKGWSRGIRCKAIFATMIENLHLPSGDSLKFQGRLYTIRYIVFDNGPTYFLKEGY